LLKDLGSFREKEAEWLDTWRAQRVVSLGVFVEQEEAMNRIIEKNVPSDTGRALPWCRCCGRPRTVAAQRVIAQEAGAVACWTFTQDGCAACGAPETAVALHPRYFFGAGI